MPSLFHTGAAVSPILQENLDLIRKLTGSSMDVVIREFRLGNGQQAAAFYIDNMVDNELLGRDFFAPLMRISQHTVCTAEQLVSDVLTMGRAETAADFDQVLESVLQGLSALFVQGADAAVIVQAIKWPQRSVEEPGTDVVIRGPREGFVESMRMNVCLLRKKIHHPDLRTESVRLGRYSRTDVALVYVESIVKKDVLHRIRERLSQIDIDAVLDSGNIEQLVQDTPASLFPTLDTAEKPDVAAARILEGRVALLVDGSPIALTLPMLFLEGIHSQEDAYTRFYYGSWMRLVRTAAFLISIFLPGGFLAACCFHQQIIPFRLLLSMSAAEADTPFSIGLSLLVIGTAYEILREAGIRLPKPAGQAMSIVGAIVMGDAAVSAGLISAPVLIVLAITVVSSFVASIYTEATTLLRLIFLGLAWVFGFYGLLLGTLALLLYLCSLESFGTPFFAPLAPWEPNAMEDSIIRFPMRRLKFRNALLSHNRRRMGQTPSIKGERS